MSVTSLHTPARQRCLDQVEKLINSHTLHGSESLCRLLRYLGEQALDHPGVSLKEYQIATEVFGRPSDFDPQLDSTIRVQAGRLRVKLADYYSTEGAHDPIVVELPKGMYALSFHERAQTGKQQLPHSPGAERDDLLTAPAPNRWATVAVILSAALAAAIVVIIVLLSKKSSATAQNEVPAAYQEFWRDFTSGPEEPWVIFSNGAFVGRPETGMRYFDSARDSRDLILDHYTGVGEVLAVHELDRVFALLHQNIRVKRGSLFTLDDAKNNNLIFVGSPAENLSLRDLPGLQEFVFERPTSGPRKGDLAILNVHPQSDEPKEFFGSRSNLPLDEDFAVIGLERGLNAAGSMVVILAGTTTIGTQAAVEYVCRQSSLEELLLRLSVSKTGDLKPFEAVLRVKVTRGVPVATELVAIRKLS